MSIGLVVEYALQLLADYVVYLAVSFVMSLAITAYRKFVRSGR